MVEDEWIEFLRRTRAYHQSSIGLLVCGSLKTAEMREGVLVDTSRESLRDPEQKLAEVEAMLTRFGG